MNINLYWGTTKKDLTNNYYYLCVYPITIILSSGINPFEGIINHSWRYLGIWKVEIIKKVPSILIIVRFYPIIYPKIKIMKNRNFFFLGLELR